jgi:D-arabinose 1-dehydrogenase-like Zn-dependent alcohol dehydrogenase
MMAKMRAVQISKAKGPFELVEREIPQPKPGQVRVKVQACGVCHSDVFVKEGLWPGLQFPRVTGHEVAGVIDALGEGVKGWKVGNRVGVGWHGGHCGYCDSCRRGNFSVCLIDREVTGFNFDGGYAEYMVVPAGTLASIPEELNAPEAAPLMCAGVTTFNSLRQTSVGPGDLVAVLGLGGLGHLGIQFAAKQGLRTVAIGRGTDEAELAKQLGAKVYIDSKTQDVANELQKMGGAKVILATAPSGEAMTNAIGGLGIDGKLVVLGVPDKPIEVPAVPVISSRSSVMGWPAGASIDSQDTMAFSALTGVRPMIETFPLERAADAYDAMLSGKVRFRAVLVTGL